MLPLETYYTEVALTSFDFIGIQHRDFKHLKEGIFNFSCTVDLGYIVWYRRSAYIQPFLTAGFYFYSVYAFGIMPYCMFLAALGV